MSKKKVLVTGLNGVVGSAIRPLFEEKYDLSSFSRYGCDDMPEEKNHKCDLKDYDSLVSAFKDQHTIVHLAADRSMRADWDTVLPYNIIGLRNVYEAARVCGVKRVVFGSSQHSIGGNYDDEPYKSVMNSEFDKVEYPFKRMDETTRIRPSGWYGVSKAFGEAVGSIYSQYHGISSINLRIGYTASTDNTGAGKSMWLSHRDAAQIHSKAVDAPMSLMYGLYFATSNNHWNLFDITKAKEELGYEPQDDAGAIVTDEDRAFVQAERDKTEFKVHPYDEE